jgi:hypothetical protein
MKQFRLIVLALFAVALATYGLDCQGTMTSDEAMQCCKEMSCSSHGQNSQDCCKTMPSLHSPFVQTAITHGVSLPHLVITVMPFVSNCSITLFSGVIPAQCHAPPSSSPCSDLPIRI